VLIINATERWQSAHVGGVIGLLEVSGLENNLSTVRLDEYKKSVEEKLRKRFLSFSRQDLLQLPALEAYTRYYKHFDKTYHVQLQLESILKGKNLPTVSLLVDANFAAEMETLVLTAGHDADLLLEPIWMDVSVIGDKMTQMTGPTRNIRAGDMVMRDAGGICCSILYGQDNRSAISLKTSHALFVAYAPSGLPVEEVERQLQRIEENIRLCSRGLVVEQKRLIRS
jgi:DNA/RNA-binding domain of Phe-tRNA-synthetase-like protein